MKVHCLRYDIICEKRGTPNECHDCHFSWIRLLTPEESTDNTKKQEKK